MSSMVVELVFDIHLFAVWSVDSALLASDSEPTVQQMRAKPDSPNQIQCPLVLLPGASLALCPGHRTGDGYSLVRE